MNRYIILILIILILLSSANIVFSKVSINNSYVEINPNYKANEGNITESSIKKWTWLFYNDADFKHGQYEGFNPMNSTAFYNVTFTDETFSGENIDMIILEDPFGSPSKMWYIDENHNKILLEELGEVNMGDFNTLKDFIQYGKENYPSERYFLSVYNHGGGWNGACIDDTSNGDILTMDEFQQALKEVGGVNVICFTGPCSMGSLESAYELRDYTDLIIGSEDISGYVYWQGTVGYICNLLNEKPDVSIDELGNEVIENIKKMDYKNYIIPNIGNRIWLERVKLCVTMSAIKTNALDNVAIAIDEFVITLMHKMNTSRFTKFQIGLVRQMTKSFGIPILPLILIKGIDIDIYDFSKKCSLVFFSDSNIKQSAKTVMDSIDEAVVANLYGLTQIGSYGLSIFFPSRFFYNSNFADLYTSKLDFANNTCWDEFLEFYYSQ